MSGEDFLCRCLEAGGLEVVFGVPGTQNVNFFEALRNSKLRTVLSTHELAAAFMAIGYFRASGRPGIVTTIPGPGFTMTLTGLAEALHDSVALLYLVVRSDPRPDGRPSLQFVDQRAMAGPVVKGTFQVSDADQLVDTVYRALSLACSEEPGPVYVEVLQSALAKDRTDDELREFSCLTRGVPDAAQLTEATGRMMSAAKSVLLLGQGASDASDVVSELSERLGMAVISNSSGRGIIPEKHPRLLCGDFSGWGGALVNGLFRESDLILALGYKFSYNGTSGYGLEIPPEKLIHVDASLTNLNRVYPAGMAIKADVGLFLQGILDRVGVRGREGRGWSAEELADWKERFEESSREGESRFPMFRGRQVGLKAFFERFRTFLPDDAMVFTDSGLHQIVTRRLLEIRSPRGLVLPSDFQSMGFGLPAAIGGTLASPGRRVVSILGDGGMAMSGMELMTAVREGIDLTVIVFSDGHLGQIRQQQLREYGHAHGTELGILDLERFAEAVGGAYLAMDGEDLEVLEEAVNNPGVTIVELLLEDSPLLGRDRVKALARAAVRRFLGPSTVNRLKRAKERVLSRS